VAKLKEQLSYVPTALISVSVDVTNSASSASPAAAAAEAQPPPATQPDAVAANMGATAATAPSDAPASRKARVVSASVAVPRSYFLAICRASNPRLEDPSEALIQPVMDAELDKVRRLVRNSLGLAREEDVTVESYFDQRADAQASADQKLAASPIAALVNLHGTELAYAGGGIMTFLLLIVLIRRTGGVRVAVQTIGATPARPQAAPRSLEQLLDEQRQFEATLMDEPARADDPVQDDEQMQDIQALVRRDPQAAAQLLEQWMNLN
jgi:flagellar biosynthesis/type III secretory pathway M-ring protein FliF/YscJ